jgi:Xaa-Pro aminopeptidase
MDHVSRLRRLREQFSRQRMDALLVSHPPNIRYLCGFTGSTATLLVTEEQAVFFTDGRYTAQAQDEVKNAKRVITRKAALPAAAEWLTAHRKSLGKGPIRIGVEGEHLTAAALAKLKLTLSSGFRLKLAPPLIEQARMVKDADEIKYLRAAVRLGAILFECAVKAIRPGVRETEVAAEMEYAARRAGAEGMSFETIIASGKRSALPHGRASQAEIPASGFVVCDFGVILAGYCSDQTRTVWVGKPPGEALRVYAAVREAQQAAVDAVRPGRNVGEVDRAARKILQRHGLAAEFSHSTGHGVGLEIHEMPRVARGQTEVLKPGMVITIEPGVYFPDRWGVRIEDMVVVTEHGCEVLTPTSKELIVL